MSHDQLNTRWDPRNRMTAARDRHRTPSNLLESFRERASGRDVLQSLRDQQHVGEVNIVPGTGNVIPIRRSLVRPISPPMLPALVRRMGETTIDQRRAVYGNESLWADTPVAATDMKPDLGDPELLDAHDVSDLLKDFERVGWQWDRKQHSLAAYLTTRGETYIVRLPLANLQRIFNRHHCAQTGEKNGPYQENTLGGFFKKLARGLKKAVKGIVKNTIKSITAPIRFFKNPKKFIKDTAAHIKKVVKGVGKTVLKVASSPIFAGVMGALAVIPPLTAVGAAGLAAFAAANAIKPAFKVVEKGIDTIDAIAKRKKIKNGINSLPPGAKNLMKGALKSTSEASSIGKQAFRLAGGALSKVF